MQLNQRAAAVVDNLTGNAETLRVAVHKLACGTRVIDLGIKVAGSLDAGLLLAQACMAGLGQVCLVPTSREFGGGPGKGRDELRTVHARADEVLAH